MTAVANPPSFQQINRSTWGGSPGQGGINAMNTDDVSRMFMPRKSVQRSNSSSSLASTASTASSASTITQLSSLGNGNAPHASPESNGWSGTGNRKKPARTGPWPASKAEPTAGVSTARPQSILTTNGTAASSMASMHQPAPIVPSQHVLQPPSIPQNGSRAMGSAAPADGQPVLYLLSMNGTFERKTITVPYYPDSLRIGRQTNAKTVPTPTNGYFDSKVLSRQHAEIWAERSGKIWIRDVKSSNGTFVNGARLSPENRDSEPHELQTQDHLELGIDIVSEDQQTVVHHKVAAKVEHAGPLNPPSNIFDMNFGDLDPANGMLLSGHPGTRGRAGSQGSMSSVRMGSVAGSNMTGASQRPMSFWLTPVTTEQIVKKLTLEMRAARLETQDLGRTKQFFDSLLSKDEMKMPGRPGARHGHHQTNGAIPFKMDTKSRFTDPPAPPPQQPLPEKPDVSRHGGSNPPSIKRSGTEKPRPDSAGSPVRPESSQILNLIEALASAKKQIDEQSARMKDLEELLRQEREARTTAEDVAKRLEEESAAAKATTTRDVDGSIVEEAFEPPTEPMTTEDAPSEPVSPAPEDPAIHLQHRIDLLLGEMKEMKQQLESYKTKAETAEAERDASQTTLAEMVARIREEESTQADTTEDEAVRAAENLSSALAPLRHHGADGVGGDGNQSAEPLVTALVRHPSFSDPSLAYHSTPYASMLGVVLIGMGIMAYLNGWQKVDR